MEVTNDGAFEFALFYLGSQQNSVSKFMEVTTGTVEIGLPTPIVIPHFRLD
jgi:hypothetical protein